MNILNKFFTLPSVVITLLSIFAIVLWNAFFLLVLLYIVSVVLIWKYYKWDSDTYTAWFFWLWIPILFFIYFFPVSIFILFYIFATYKNKIYE